MKGPRKCGVTLKVLLIKILKMEISFKSKGTVMDYRNLFREENEAVEERYNLVMDRISALGGRKRP